MYSTELPHDVAGAPVGFNGRGLMLLMPGREAGVLLVYEAA